MFATAVGAVIATPPVIDPALKNVSWDDDWKSVGHTSLIADALPSTDTATDPPHRAWGTREATVEETFLQHLAAQIEGFAGLQYGEQHGLAYLTLIAATSQRPHSTHSGYTSFDYRDLWHLFGRAEFPRINESAPMFEVLPEGPGMTRAYRLLPAVAAIVSDYLRSPVVGPTYHVTAGGDRVTKLPAAIASLNSEGRKRRVWLDVDVANKVNVDVPRLRELSEEWMLLPEDSLSERKRNKLAAFIRLANTRAAGPGCIGLRYVACRTGRLNLQGPVTFHNVHTEIRRAALHGYWEYDVANCHPAIFMQMAARYGCETPAIADYVARKHAIRHGIAARVGISYDDAKQCLLMFMFGARESLWGGIEGVSPAAAIPKLITVAAASRLYKDHEWTAISRDVQRGRKAILTGQRVRRGRIRNAMGLSCSTSEDDSQQLAHLIQGVEARAVQAVVNRHPGAIAVLMHDGWDCAERMDRALLERTISEATGYELTLEERPPTAE